MKNVLWLQVNSRKLCFSYNHSIEAIEIKEGTIQGTILASFNNSTPILDVKIFFERL